MSDLKAAAAAAGGFFESESPLELPAKAADRLADQLRQRIFAGEWRTGDILPTERELVEHSGLSRASVREALRILGGEGLISTRAGRGGGSAVRLPTHDVIGRSVRLFIRGRRSGIDALVEAREAIEPSVSQLAARHRTDEDLAQLEAIQQRLSRSRTNRRAFLRANIDWHLAVAQASHNPLLIAFMTAISQEMLNWTSGEAFETEQIVEQTIRAHAQIIAAIRRQDADAASRRMQRHVASYSAVAKSTVRAKAS
jgi:DNA-binding FadR family transcriptional regulator